MRLARNCRASPQLKVFPGLLAACQSKDEAHEILSFPLACIIMKIGLSP